jgi:hypothetical protein
VKITNRDFASPQELLDRLEDRRHYAGFFQSEGFFENEAARVRAAFTPLQQHRVRVEARYANLLSRRYI